jgi:hypothetical protein
VVTIWHDGRVCCRCGTACRLSSSDGLGCVECTVEFVEQSALHPPDELSDAFGLCSPAAWLKPH